MEDKQFNMGQNVIQLKRFNMKNMVEHTTIAMIAKRGSGKSWLVREIMYNKRKIPSAIVVSQTEKLNCFYGDHIPDLYIYNKFDTKILNKIYSRQGRLADKNKLKRKEGKKEIDDRVLLIMDDCMSSKGSWIKDDNILELFFNGRHHHISFILTMQFSLGIPPELRSNFDYIFLLGEDFMSNKKRLYDHYAGMFPNFEMFSQVFNNVTDNFGCMVIDNRTKSKKIEDKVFWYRAKDTKKFVLGSKKFKKYAEKNYDPKWNKRLQFFDIQDVYSKKKNNINVTVKKIKND